MKHSISVLFILTFLATNIFSQAKKVKTELQQPITCEKSEYKLVFEDDFNGNHLDTTKWYTYYPYGPENKKDSCAFCRTHVLANIYKDENCILEDGILKLKSDREKGEWFGKTYDFTSALVHSKQIFNTYGKYEIRCKLPAGKQQWPAFWIFGWSTEIDIFEFICKGPQKIELSVHNWMSHDCKNKNAKKGLPCYSSQSKVVDFGIDFSKEFHTFSVEYEETMIKFYIDDIMIRYVPKYYDLKGRPINTCNIERGKYLVDPSFPNYGEPVSVIANQGICYKHKEKNPIYPNYMEVDYIRVYQKAIQNGLSAIK